MTYDRVGPYNIFLFYIKQNYSERITIRQKDTIKIVPKDTVYRLDHNPEETRKLGLQDCESKWN